MFKIWSPICQASDVDAQQNMCCLAFLRTASHSALQHSQTLHFAFFFLRFTYFLTKFCCKLASLPFLQFSTATINAEMLTRLHCVQTNCHGNFISKFFFFCSRKLQKKQILKFQFLLEFGHLILISQHLILAMQKITKIMK